MSHRCSRPHTARRTLGTSSCRVWASPPALPRHRSPRRLQSLRSVSRLAGVLSKRFPSLTRWWNRPTLTTAIYLVATQVAEAEQGPEAEITSDEPGVARQDNVMMCAEDIVCARVNAPACVCAVSARRPEAVQEGGGVAEHHVLLREIVGRRGHLVVEVRGVKVWQCADVWLHRSPRDQRSSVKQKRSARTVQSVW